MKSPIQLGKPQHPTHCDEEEKAAKVETKNTNENKLIDTLTGKPVPKRANTSITAQAM